MEMVKVRQKINITNIELKLAQYGTDARKEEEAGTSVGRVNKKE